MTDGRSGSTPWLEMLFPLDTVRRDFMIPFAKSTGRQRQRHARRVYHRAVRWREWVRLNYYPVIRLIPRQRLDGSAARVP